MSASCFQCVCAVACVRAFVRACASREEGEEVGVLGAGRDGLVAAHKKEAEVPRWCVCVCVRWVGWVGRKSGGRMEGGREGGRVENGGWRGEGREGRREQRRKCSVTHEHHLE